MLLIALLNATAFAQQAAVTPPDPLRDGFLNPPPEARPFVWWHWMNGNISKEGIRADLEWMHRIGLGGVQVFDAALATPKIVDHRIEYMTPEWKDDFRYAVSLTDRFGMELGIAGSPGWSETGGPWVPPSEAMKKYVWSETSIEGGKPYTGKLIHPPTITGKFQNTPAFDPHITEPALYADAKVVAFKRPIDEAAFVMPTMSTGRGRIATPDLLADDNAATFVMIQSGDKDDGPWLQAEYPAPITIRSITLSVGREARGAPTGAALEASDDGLSYRLVTPIPAGGAVEQTLTFAPTTARFFRLSFDQRGRAHEDVQINEFRLHTDARVHHFEEKAAFQQMLDLYSFATPSVDLSSTVSKSVVIDLTSRFHEDGTLDWSPPPGKWTILRIGYSLIGTTNHPATAEATGLEVDKLDHRYVKNYLDNYLNSYRDTVGAQEMGSRGIRAVITDSWEAGTQNWTDDMLTQFQKLRGYDPTPWLPVLAGHVVESASASDRFLWDFRKTIADLTADEHYGQIHASLKERNLQHYGESHEGDRAFIGDGMEVKKRADVPMGAMWTQPIGVHTESFRYNADDRESASVAHIYGQNIAAAESMTAKVEAWAYSPETLKPTVDQEFLNGINRIVIHESTHQPVADKIPGLTLGIYGQWFNRNETWAEQARPWIDYLARNSFMLQQGRFAADVLYFYGEDSNITAIFRDRAPNVPSEYGFDYIDADGLVHDVSVTAGQITTRSGMRYRLLVLDPYTRHMSLPVLRSIYSLVSDGAILAGPKPVDTPSLADSSTEFTRLLTDLFGDGRGVHTVGKGKVYAGSDASSALEALHAVPDFTYTKSRSDSRIEFIHRTSSNADIYFVDNRSDHDERFEARFRVTGRKPELWRAESGSTEALSYRMVDGETAVPMRLSAWESVFLVFRHRVAAKSFTAPSTVQTKLANLEGPWKLNFQPHRGAPTSIMLAQLTSWSTSSVNGVKYFSGAATYSKAIQAPKGWFSKRSHIFMDLGEVKNLATLTVNGEELGVGWHNPYRFDVTSSLKPGSNSITITVINSWVNRLIGDQQPNATKYTYTDFTPYNANSTLFPSGLIGPVQVLRVQAGK